MKKQLINLKPNGGGGSGSKKYLHSLRFNVNNTYFADLSGSNTLYIHYHIITDTDTPLTLSDLYSKIVEISNVGQLRDVVCNVVCQNNETYKATSVDAYVNKIAINIVKTIYQIDNGAISISTINRECRIDKTATIPNYLDYITEL